MVVVEAETRVEVAMAMNLGPAAKSVGFEDAATEAELSLVVR